MRIHSDTLTQKDLRDALGSVPGRQVYFEDSPTEHGSRSHDRAFEVRLRGLGDRHTRRPMYAWRTGTDGMAATYDDWGYFLAHLFEVDPDAKAGPYDGRGDFNSQTRYAYDATYARS